MKQFRVDMHIHTVLSPCASLEMSPDRILRSAKEQGLDMIAITDHNSTLQVRTVIEMAKGSGLKVIAGVEINSKEEVHALAYFPDLKQLDEFQVFIDTYLPKVINKPELFGDQVVVNHKNKIVYEEERLLISALNIDLKSIEQRVHELKGIFIPAHVGRRANGIVSQLGIIPDDLMCDALEVTSTANLENLNLRFGKNNLASWVCNSDAHYPDQIAKAATEVLMMEASFEEYRLALKAEEGRSVSNLIMKA